MKCNIEQYNLYVPKVSLVWSTTNGDALVAEMARVSVLDNKNKPIEKLVKYLADHKHNSPFEMVNMCIELFAPRDITRQLIRHRSFSFQEFSGRYAEYPDSAFVLREPRNQHPSNRQMSIDMPLNTPEDKIKYEHLLEKQVIAINTARPTKWYHDIKLEELGINEEDFLDDFYHGEEFNCSFTNNQCLQDSISNTKVKHLNTLFFSL